MRFSASAIAVLALSLEIGGAIAQPAVQPSTTPQMPSDQQIRAVMEQQRKGLKDQGVLGAGAASRVQPVAPGTYKTEVFPGTLPDAAGKKRDTPTGDNLEELVSKYNSALRGDAPKAVSARGDLVVFVSLSMPKEVLTELSRQAKEMGAMLVLRGFKDGSVDKTRIAAQEVNPSGAPWEIHPDLFKAFKVNKVPTIVLANAASGSLDEEGCAPEATYGSVSGNVSLELALNTLRLRGRPDIAKLAELRLADLRSRNAPAKLR